MNKKLVIIDYGLGNLASIANALEALAVPYQISSDPSVLKNASGLILPGVGAAGVGMKNLKKKGLDKVIGKEIKKGKPILGICLGMQLLLSFSEEGNVACLDLIEGKVKKFTTRLKIPQIGWNNVRIKNNELRIMEDVKNNSYFYFVNRFYCEPQDENIIAGMTDYDGEFCSVFVKDNIVGMQFHPEKSGSVGFKLLKNFITNYVN
jgi:imidazole glycerol-phosphate synthase subunit HisH